MHTLRPRRLLRLSPLLACAGLAACLVGPNYRRPSGPTPAAYKEAAGWAPARPSDAADRRDWWTVFGDPTLNALETRVATSNQTLAGAEAAYRQARALVAQQRAALFPIVSLNGAASVSGNRVTTPVIVGTPPPTVEFVTTQAYSLGLGATWEPDLWGRVRRTIENARANAQASAADLANTRLSAQMELADDYISLRQFDEEKRLLDATAAGYARSLTIAQNRYKVGVAAKSDVLSAQSQLQTTQADDADLVQQRARVEHAIAILTGQPPATLTLTPAPWTLRLPLIPAALPSTLLQRRPDIAAAERLAAAANALIGVQTAAYYPNLALTGQAGLGASGLGQLFNTSNFVWSLGASAAETIFDAGARRAGVAQARAAYDQAVANYRQTVLVAFGQVEDNLAAQRVLAGELALRQAAAQAAEANAVIARNQYLAGQTDYTAVVVAQATALAARTTQLQIEAARLTAAVDLIAALGGGWTAGAAP
ncbi:MAG: efflux transporter outer membrane subunit [Caulobacteraceae bacterium]